MFEILKLRGDYSFLILKNLNIIKYLKQGTDCKPEIFLLDSSCDITEISVNEFQV